MNVHLVQLRLMMGSMKDLLSTFHKVHRKSNQPWYKFDQTFSTFTRLVWKHLSLHHFQLLQNIGVDCTQVPRNHSHHDDDVWWVPSSIVRLTHVITIVTLSEAEPVIYEPRSQRPCIIQLKCSYTIENTFGSGVVWKYERKRIENLPPVEFAKSEESAR